MNNNDNQVGRPPLMGAGSYAPRLNTTVTPQIIECVEHLGDGNRSAGVRAMFEEWQSVGDLVALCRAWVDACDQSRFVGGSLEAIRPLYAQTSEFLEGMTMRNKAKDDYAKGASRDSQDRLP